MAELGRAALLLSFGLVVYALAAGSLAAWQRRRRLALSAQNALIAAFASTAVAAVVLGAVDAVTNWAGVVLLISTVGQFFARGFELLGELGNQHGFAGKEAVGVDLKDVSRAF